MDEKKLVKLLEEKFVTKNEFNDFCYEMRGFRKEMIDEFKIVNEKLDESKSSSNTFDEMLEKFPMERIARLEKHSKLPPFIPAVAIE